MPKFKKDDHTVFTANAVEGTRLRAMGYKLVKENLTKEQKEAEKAEADRLEAILAGRKALREASAQSATQTTVAPDTTGSGNGDSNS